MNKNEFIQSLSANLNNISNEEKNDIIQYYTEYFDDAGEENVEKVLEELGDPVKLAGLHVEMAESKLNMTDGNAVSAEDKVNSTEGNFAGNINQGMSANAGAAMGNEAIEKTALMRYQEYKNNINNGARYNSYNQGNGGVNANNKNKPMSVGKIVAIIAIIVGAVITGFVLLAVFVFIPAAKSAYTAAENITGHIVEGVEDELGVGKVREFLGDLGINSEDYTIDSTTLNEKFNEISVDVGCADVDISYGDDYLVTIESIDEIETMQAEVQNGKLVIVGKSAGNELKELINAGLSFLKSDGRVAKIRIIIPQNASLNRIFVDDDCGTITISGNDKLTLAKEIEVKNNAGNITARNVNADKGAFTLECGNFDSKECNIKEFRVDESLGDIDVKNITAESVNMTQSCGDIDISVKGATPKITASNDLGNITIKLADKGKDVAYDLNVSLGTIKFNGEKVSSPYNTSGKTIVSLKGSLGNIDINY